MHRLREQKSFAILRAVAWYVTLSLRLLLLDRDEQHIDGVSASRTTGLPVTERAALLLELDV